ncbi:MAG: hypothetical protein ABI175_04900, partial [Polyangiales bacterium]
RYHVENVVVSCGTKVLFDDKDQLEGMSQNGSAADQHEGEKKGSWSYSFLFSDVGQRGPSRNQVMLDSSKKLGKVWSDNLPELRVDLALEPESEPTDKAVQGE